MSLTRYIAGCFNRYRTLPPSLKAMRVIAVVGIAVATATLVVTLAILTGFEREYQRTILDFNAHVVLLKAGEIDGMRDLDALIGEFRMTDADRAYLADHRIAAYALSTADAVWQRYAGWHRRLAYHIPAKSRLASCMARIEPRAVGAVLPQRMREFVARARERERRGVVGATPFIYREALMIAGGTIAGVVIKGVDSSTLRDVNPMRIDLMEGGRSLASALEGGRDIPSVIIGTALAAKLGIDTQRPRQTVRLLAPTTDIGRGARHFRELAVTGVFESGLYDYDAQFALMSLDGARALFGVPAGNVTGLELRLADPHTARRVGARMEARMGPSWRAIPWSELNADIFSAVEMEKRTFSIIMGMLMVVAAFNIIGVLVLMILVRSREIAILRALGMSSCELTRVFTRGGIAIGGMGVAAGLVFGIGSALALKGFDIVTIAPEIYFLNHLPIDISPYVCGMIAIFCLAVCWLTSRAAARKLAEIPIVEGLSGMR